MENFIPENYTQPVPDSKFLKLEKGETKIRFISSPVMGWVYWTEDPENLDGKRKSHRSRMGDPIPNALLKPKHFWAAIVYDYNAKSVKILEITQKTIQTAIINLNKNKAWGNPKNYDICIVRVGDNMDTEYSVMPEPNTAQLPPDILSEALQINLEKLFTGEDPFKQ